MTKPLHVVSLGAGVQSSTMALMFAVGELEPMPDLAIFADTGAEPKHVYDWLDSLEARLPFPIHRVMWREGLTANIYSAIDGGKFAGAPFFTESKKNKVGQLRRQCTREFKIQPITKGLRRLLGLAPRQRAPQEILVKQYIGISLDEVGRMRDSLKMWIENCYPLVDKRMQRLDCLNWMHSHGFPKPPRSACSYCPYHSDREWRDLKVHAPDDFAEAVALDEKIRAGVRGTTQPRKKALPKFPYRFECSTCPSVETVYAHNTELAGVKIIGRGWLRNPNHCRYCVLAADQKRTQVLESGT